MKLVKRSFLTLLPMLEEGQLLLELLAAGTSDCN